MSAVLGELLPLAAGVAISPVPIIVVILMLLAPRAGRTSAGFLFGWLLGILVATTVLVVIAEVVGLSSPSGRSPAASWIRIVLGVLLLALAWRRWRRRPRAGAEPPLPAWMAAVDSFTPLKSVGLGFLLSAVNPKNLTMCAAAGVAIGSAAPRTGQAVLAVVVFTVIAGATVAVPVAGYALAADRLRSPLDSLRHWLVHNNDTVMGVLLIILGAVVLGKGIGGLG